MFSLYQLINLFYNSLIFANTTHVGPNFWVFIVVVILISGIILSILLIFKSNKAEDWYHESFVDDEFYMSGRLGILASKINNLPVDYSDNSLLKNDIEMLFFEKIRKNYGFNYEEIIDMKYNNPEKLRAVINDDYIFNWIIDFQSMRKQKNSFFDRTSNSKEVFFENINQVLDRMEVWGK